MTKNKNRGNKHERKVAEKRILFSFHLLIEISRLIHDMDDMDDIITLVRYATFMFVQFHSRDRQKVSVSKALLMEMSQLMMAILSSTYLINTDKEVDDGDNDVQGSELGREIVIHQFSGAVLRVVVEYMQKKKEYDL